MQKYRILFSRVNTESRFLATLLQKKLHQQPAAAVDGGYYVKPTASLVEYHREVDYAPTSEVDDTHVVGVEMHASHLLAELKHTAGLVNIYAYDEQYDGIVEQVRALGKLDDKDVDRIVLHKNMTNTIHRKNLLPGDSLDFSTPFHFLVLGDWLNENAPPMDKVTVASGMMPDNPSVELRAARIMHQYQNLEALDRAELITAQDNLHELDLCDMEAAREFTPRVWRETHPLEDKFKELLLMRATTAKYIERTLRNQYVGSQQNGRLMLNMSMPREHAVYAARLLSYAHDRFMMYEDGNNCRVWTIVAPTVHEAKGLAELLKPHDVWSEKRFVYCITDLPKLT